MSIKILLTCAGGGLAPHVIRMFKESKVYKNTKVYAVDINKNASGKYFADYFQTVSNGKSKNFIRQINKICKKFKINLILPGSDEDALNLTKNRHIIETNYTKIASVSFKTLKILSDKSKTYNYLKKFNIPTPLWYLAKNKKDLFNCIKKFTLKKKDIAIKPCVSRGGRNVYIISKKIKREIFKNKGRQIELNIDILKRKYLKSIIKIFPVIVMEKLSNPCFDFDMLCKNGKLIQGVTRKRVNSAVPNDGHYLENRSDIFNIGKKISKCFGLTWLYDCDFMLDDKKKPKVIEVNPRMSGSAAISVAAGIPLFDNLISIYKNKKIKKIKYSNKKLILRSINKKF